MAQVLRDRKDEAQAAFGIAGLVNDQQAAGMGAQVGVGLPLRQPTAIERLGIPRRVMQEVVQALPVGARYDRAQLDQGLIVLARQEQPNQVLAQRRAFLVAGQEV